MKSLQEIKDEVFNERGLNEWSYADWMVLYTNITYCETTIQQYIDAVAKRYAEQAIDECILQITLNERFEIDTSPFITVKNKFY